MHLTRYSLRGKRYSQLQVLRIQIVPLKCLSCHPQDWAAAATKVTLALLQQRDDLSNSHRVLEVQEMGEREVALRRGWREAIERGTA